MKAFDSATYLKEILGPYVDSTELPDMFERYCLEPSDSDDAAITKRCREVKQLWDMRVDRPKYGPMIRLLLDRHGEAVLTLEDPAERRRAAAEASQAEGARAEHSKQALAQWEGLLAQALKQHRGLDPVMRATLEKAADRLGLDAAMARAQLDAAPVAALQSMLTADERRDIRKALTSLAQDAGEQRIGLSLFHALGLSGITADVTEIKARHAELDNQNVVRKRGNTRVLYETMLVIAKRVLIDGDPRVYVESLVSDVREALEADGIKASFDDGVIDEMEAEQLSRRGVELGLTTELARRVVAELARELGVVLQRTGAPVDYIVCGVCSHVEARDHASEHCGECGAPLFATCPNDQCGTLNDASAARCRKCGADLRRFAEAARRLSELGNLLHAGSLQQASEQLAELKSVLGATPEVERYAGELKAAMQKAEAAWSATETAIVERRLYAARRMLQDLRTTASDLPGPEGLTPAERAVWVAERLHAADRALQRARTANGSTREVALAEALNIAADCQEAKQELERIPASSPREVQATMAEAHAVISWQASPTPGVSYEITRTASDGTHELVSDSEQGLHVADSHAASGSVVRYDVVAIRGSSRSPPASSAPIVIARELQGIAVFSGDGEVRLTWAAIGAQGRVLVRRRHDRSGADDSLAPDSTGVVDRNVTNGESYAYDLRVQYVGPAGEHVLTRGATVFAQPSTRPSPIAITGAQTSSAGVIISFPRPTVGSVIILKCTDQPQLEAGDELDPSALPGLGTVLSPHAAGVLDPDTQTGAHWYLPVTAAGTMAIAGPPFRYLAFPGVSNVRAVDDGRAVRVTWTWPETLRNVLVAWRTDRQPEGPEDSNAHSQTFRRSEYKDRGGFVIDASDGESIFVTIFPAARIGNDIVYGTAASRDSRAAVTRVRRTNVRYTVRRTGVRKKKLEIDVQAPPGVELPEMVIVTRPGDLVPRKPDDGDVVGRLGGSGPLQSTLDLAGRSTPLAVRLFLSTPSAQASHRLVDPAVDNLVFR
jgi:hypothetical protein